MTTTTEQAPALERRGLGEQEISPSDANGSASVADSAGVIVAIDRILVQNRYRTDLGPVGELAASIVEIGLLNPITVTEYHGGFRLVAGERRLRAFQSLGLTDIPARIARNIYEARDLLVAERDENTQRKEMLRSEAAALGMAIEALEKPAALARRGHGITAPGRNAPGPGTRSVEELRPRDIAAEAIGMGEAQEAALFLAFNNRRTINAYDKFVVGVTADLAVPADINRVVMSLGLRVEKSRKPGSVSAVGALDRVYRMGGAVLLRKTLATTRDAWAGMGFDSEVVKGVALFINRYEGRFDEARLVKKLSEIPSGARGLRQYAYVAKEAFGSTLDIAHAAAVTDVYNKGLRGVASLGSWWKDGGQ